MRRSWVYTPDGRCIEKGTPEWRDYESARLGASPMVFSDEGVFVSPIDGLAYSGKAGMREHNKRHDVVNHRDLTGLPYELPKAKPNPMDIRRAIIETAQRKGYFNGQ
jgi:hypothetical protein